MAAVEKLVTQHLDLLATAIKRKSAAGRGSSSKVELYGIKKLRELILELAIRGLLVRQDPKDEPASESLKKITAEKAKLVREGKIKQGKALPQVGAAWQQDLPDGWIWTCLAALGEVSPRNDVGDDINASFIPMPLISTRFDGRHDHEPRKWGDIRKGYTHFADGDIAIAKITPCFENSKAAIFSGLHNGVGAGTTELHVLRPYGDFVSRGFLLLYLKSPQFLRVGETKMTGSAGQKRLPTDFFSFNPLALPPLSEQHRIVAKVDELMALGDQLEQQTDTSVSAHQTLVATLLNALTSAADHAQFARSWQRIAEHFHTLFTTEESIDQLKQTILQLAVMGKLVSQDPNDEPSSELLKRIASEKAGLISLGKLKKDRALAVITKGEKKLDIPSGWEYVRLQAIAAIGTGATPARDDSSYYSPAEFSWVTSGETSLPFVSETREKISAKAIAETNVTIYPPGTLIVAMYGQGKTRGQITELLIPAGTNQACAAIQLIDQTPAHRAYIKVFFQKAYEDIRSLAEGGAQPNLNAGKIAETVLPLPPLAEQHRIVAKVEELMALCDNLKGRLADAQTTQLHLADALAEQALVED
ncbi:type I restriction enzyme S subunit [Pseudacidovorax intermedius]|uniref:Type I restriction enzyme S subunit n=1 Tax=Pseudacidovorax intermedius TaxID=433924 RepID=A0A370FPH3_9BURK|nr:restriction endonuclease subunit S [Pseudacidovorax intermedius]RDI28259.1 type I restriction enzyme S subunit [Pseudacidovorax intermedius]